MHPIQRRRSKSQGMPLNSSSPLALELSRLLRDTPHVAPKVVETAGNGEVLYRLVVPAKIAAQMSEGLVKPLSSKAVRGGIHGALRDAQGIVANATFVPVAASAKSATVRGASVGVAGAGLAGGAASATTVAAPIVLMAVAVGMSAHAERQRERAIERVTELLEQLKDDHLELERTRLDGCRDSIDKATSILLDQGRIGQSLGLDSASYEISAALSSVRNRLSKWEAGLDGLKDGPVDLEELEAIFPGIVNDYGAFHAHVEIAALAIALKHRVLVLQAVEHAQLAGDGNPFTAFMRTLHEDERRLNELETRIKQIMRRLSELELKRPGGLLKKVHYAPSEVDKLLSAAYRLKGLASEVGGMRGHSDVMIEIERRRDGSLVVFPAEERVEASGSR